MTPSQFPPNICFALEHCFDEPSVEDITQWYLEHPIPSVRPCIIPPFQADGSCGHTLCGFGSSRDPRALQGECVEVVSHLLKMALLRFTRFARFDVEIREGAKNWSIAWRGGPNVPDVRYILDAAGLVSDRSKVELVRTPLAREMRIATRRLAKHLGVSLPFENDEFRDLGTREKSVFLGAWCAFRIGDTTTLEDWILEIANDERVPSDIPSECLISWLASSDVYQSEFAFILVGAGLRPGRKTAPRRAVRPVEERYPFGPVKSAVPRPS